ncbi:MAG: DnaA N-terminal domain-containing protein [Planctomycetota bacterium]
MVSFHESHGTSLSSSAGTGSGGLSSEGQLIIELFRQIESRLDAREFATWFRETHCSFRSPSTFVFSSSNEFRRSWIEKQYSQLLKSIANELRGQPTRIAFDVDSRPSGLRFSDVADTQGGPHAAGSPPWETSDSRGSSDSAQAIPNQGDPIRGSGSHSATTRSSASWAEPLDAAPVEPVSGKPVSGEPDSGEPVQRGRRNSGSTLSLPFRNAQPENNFDQFVTGSSNRIAHAAAVTSVEERFSGADELTYNPLLIYMH